MAVDTTTAERAALIERFVHLDVVDLFLQNLDAIDDEQMFPRSVLTGEAGDVKLGALELGDRLWPTEAEYESAEGRAAHARSYAGVASVFALLSTDKGRDYCARQAAFFASLAAKGMSEATAPPPEDEVSAKLAAMRAAAEDAAA